MHRYLSHRINARRKFYILLAVFALPICLEFYQFIIPIRHHSYYDILTAYGGLLSGVVFFVLQKPVMKIDLQASQNVQFDYFHHYSTYFKYLLVIYVGYGLMYSRFSAFSMEFPIPASATELSRIKQWRLHLLMHFNKEVFTFLPTGFILTFIQSEWKSKKWKISAYIAFSLFIAYYLFQLYHWNHYFFIHFIAWSLGLWLGHFFWKIFRFLIIRQTNEDENIT